MPRILICGSRSWSNPFRVRLEVARLRQKYSHDLLIVCGDAQGADDMVRECCEELGVSHELYLAANKTYPPWSRRRVFPISDWNRDGNRAGRLRNVAMLQSGVVGCVAFRSCGESRGTDMMVGLCERAGVPVIVYTEDGLYQVRQRVLPYRSGDLFQSNAEALVNPVNCVGVAGAGLAARFRELFPRNFDEYKAGCARGLVKPGGLFIVETGLGSPELIVNLATKRHWQDASRLEDVEAGLQALVEVIQRRSINTIAIPALGCGLGGLAWPAVQEVIERVCIPVADRLELYAPHEI